jgi:hypothetical protein
MKNVKSYTDKQIWDKILSIGGSYPDKRKLVFVAIQSNEDEPNDFDDKHYTYIGNGKNKMPTFWGVTSCTTNAGINGLKHYEIYNKYGVFVWKTDEYYEDCFQAGYHRASRADGGMKAWVIIKKVKYFRDGNHNSKAEQIGKMYIGNKGTNTHGCDYNRLSRRVRKYINGWSLGCIVLNDMRYYWKWIDRFWYKGRK